VGQAAFGCFSGGIRLVVHNLHALIRAGPTHRSETSARQARRGHPAGARMTVPAGGAARYPDKRPACHFPSGLKNL